MRYLNLYCIVAKTKSGKDSYLNAILEDKRFVKETKISIFKYGTTKKYHPLYNRQEYYVVSNEEAESLDYNTLIEMRSYYTLPEGVVHYFTREKDIIPISGNYICIATPNQYERYKLWCENANLKYTDKKYNLKMIYIDSTITDRIERMLNTIEDECNLAEVCRRIIQDKTDFENAKKSLEEIANPLTSDSVCFIQSAYELETHNEHFDANLKKIQDYIRITSKKDD